MKNLFTLIISFVLLFLSNNYGWGQTDLLEDFENMTGSGSYGGANVTFSTGLWRVVGYTTMDVNDRYNGVRSVRLRGNANDSCHVTMLFDKPNGLGYLKFKYGSYSTHEGGQLSAYYSTDQGKSWTLITSIIAPTWINGGEELQTANLFVNVSGNIRVKIARDGNLANFTSVNIDDIEITDYNGTDPIILVSPMEINFGAVKINNNSTPVSVSISGANLTEDINYTLSGTNSSAFTITETNWNAASGGTLSVTFTPTETDTYNATLVISSTGAANKSVVLTGTGVTGIIPAANFTADKTTIQTGETVQFTDLSSGNPTSFAWTFTGGTPSTSTLQTPSIVYNEVGIFNVSLTVSNEDGSDTKLKNGYINVYEGGWFFEDFEGMTGGGTSNYSGASVTFATGSWYVKGITNMDANDRRNGERSIRLRGNATDEGHRVEMEFDKADGAGIVSFKYASYSSHSGGKIRLFVSSDRGASWEAAGDEITVPSWSAGGSVMHSTSISVNKTGLTRIKIEKVNAANNTSVNIDDIEITDYSSTDPVLLITSPVNNSNIYENNVEVKFNVINFILGTDGRVKWTINESAPEYVTQSPILLKDLDYGLYTVTLELVDMSNNSLSEPAIVSRSFNIVEIPYLTIREIQETDDPSGDSPYINQIVKTKGIVTATHQNTGYFIQDGFGAWNGIYVYTNTATGLPEICDEVTVVGMVIEYYGFTEITNSNSPAIEVVTIIHSSDNDSPDPIILTTAAANGEEYEGVLVKIKNAKVINGPNQFNEYTVNDGSGNLVVDDKLFSFDNLIIGNNYDIVGVMDYSYNSARILPRQTFDVLFSGVNTLSMENNIKVYPNPTQGELKIENGELKIGNIEIYDISGRQVLLSSFGEGRGEKSFGGGSVEVDISHLPAGVYFLRVNGNMVKIVKI